MINQQVNLFQDRFREPKLILSATKSAALMLLTLLVLAGSSYWYDAVLRQETQLRNDYLKQKNTATKALESLRARLEVELADKRVDMELQQVTAEVAARQRMVDFLEHNQLGKGHGFSPNLSELADLRIDDVWLNEIALANDFIRLSGSALKAENIPLYFKQFQQRDLFEGRLFEVFEVARASNSDWKVDFIIASKVASSD